MAVGIAPTSGMKSAMKNMETISNNIANSNTIGFKKSTLNFSEIHSSNMYESLSIGTGVKIDSISQDFSNGTTETTSRGLDVALNNSGFLVQKNPVKGDVSYTRAGRLELDREGFLTGLGGRIQGYPAIDGKISNTGSLTDLSIPDTAIPAKATGEVALSLNLDANSTTKVLPIDINDPDSYNFRTDTTFYDSLGNPSVLTAYYAKTATNTWHAESFVGSTSIGSGTMNFNSSGALTTVPPTITGNYNPTNGAQAPQALTVNLTGSTQFAGENHLGSNSQDGGPSGVPGGYNIDQNGVINVFYSNGQSHVQGQIALADFRSPQFLTKSDNMSWVDMSGDGNVLINPQNSVGAFTTGSVELSNVDLTEEMVKLLSAQHDFQANAQAQQVFSQSLKTIESLG